MIELDQITGVFVGMWDNRRLYAVYYSAEGCEYLAHMRDGGWQIVSWKDQGKVETTLEHPIEAPHPVTVAYDLIADELIGGGDQIVI